MAFRRATQGGFRWAREIRGQSKPEQATETVGALGPLRREPDTVRSDGPNRLPARQGERMSSRKDSINKMRELLVTRRNALRKALAGDLSLLKQLREQTGGDVVDAALDAAQDEISSQLAEVESRELANIERALVLIKKGTYGVCEICGERIPLARLNALPYATSCIECQRAAETSGGANGQGGDWSRVLDTGFSDVDVSFSDLET